MQELKKNKKGFTLVELVVVIAILAVLVTLIVPKIMGNVADAKRNTEIANARTLASEITVWNAKQATAGTKVKDADSDGILKESDYINAGKSLPTGVTWPDSNVAVITFDTDGNAGVNIKQP